MAQPDSDVMVYMTLTQFTALIRQTSKHRDDPPAQCAGHLAGKGAGDATFSGIFPSRFGDTLDDLVREYAETGVTIQNITLTHVG